MTWVLALKVTDPAGALALDEEIALPADRTVPSPDGRYLLGVYGARFDEGRGVLEVVAGRAKDGRPRPRVRRSDELDPYVPLTATVDWRDDRWTVEATLGRSWEAPPPVEPAPDPSRYALAWDDAALLASPRQPGSAVRERELPARVDPATQASPVKIVDRWGETHLEVETVPRPLPAHCVSGGPPTEDWPLQSYVALTDLVPLVTARELTAGHADGTGYRVAAGVPVLRDADGTLRVSIGGLSFPIAAADGDLDVAYRPSAHFPAGEAPVALPPGRVGTTALGPVAWAGPEPLPVVGLAGVRDPVATVRVACAEAKMRVDATLLGGS